MKFLKKMKMLKSNRIVDFYLIIRGIYFWGRTYTCSCCNRSFRAFLMGGGSFKVRKNGYCPRCNSKSRHRRDWLFLKSQTELFKNNMNLLHISPAYCFSRNLVKMKNLNYVAADIEKNLNLSIRLNLMSLPFNSEKFDAVICIHVLEHVQDDILAIKEIERVLRVGGWALISVPIRLDQNTYEDSSIVRPEERRSAFGEESHFRYYGIDLIDRLKKSGFDVRMDPGTNLDKKIMMKYGLNDDENIFYCIKRKGEVATE